MNVNGTATFGLTNAFRSGVALLDRSQLQASMGIPKGHEWEPFAGTAVPEPNLRQYDPIDTRARRDPSDNWLLQCKR